MSNSKEKLLQLEASGNYVFHGSPDGTITHLEPRQARHVPDLSKPTETILDGNPAVAATPHVDFAIFRALINGTNVPFSHGSGFGIERGEKMFRVSSENVLDEVEDKKGHVYVFDKTAFEPHNRDGEDPTDNMEWRSYTTVQPIDVVEVGYEDLPARENIKIGN